eukprot:2337662-Rhodomonas_salina.1
MSCIALVQSQRRPQVDATCEGTSERVLVAGEWRAWQAEGAGEPKKQEENREGDAHARHTLDELHPPTSTAR